MYETTKTHLGTQFIRIPYTTLWIDRFPQQVDSARQIHGCGRRAVNQITKGKEMPTWIRSLSS